MYIDLIYMYTWLQSRINLSLAFTILQNWYKIIILNELNLLEKCKLKSKRGITRHPIKWLKIMRTIPVLTRTWSDKNYCPLMEMPNSKSAVGHSLNTHHRSQLFQCQESYSREMNAISKQMFIATVFLTAPN